MPDRFLFVAIVARPAGLMFLHSEHYMPPR